jgi:hypothetical protein
MDWGAGIERATSNIRSIRNPRIWRSSSTFYLIKRVVQWQQFSVPEMPHRGIARENFVKKNPRTPYLTLVATPNDSYPPCRGIRSC